jgi:hypothetical protein
MRRDVVGFGKKLQEITIRIYDTLKFSCLNRI